MTMIIPEGVRYSLFNYYVKDMNATGAKMPTYDRFFEECLSICHEMNIPLQSNWSSFYDECNKRKISHKNTSTTEPQSPTPINMRDSITNEEEDYWKIECANAKHAFKIPNPYKDRMESISPIHKELYALSKEVLDNPLDKKIVNSYYEQLKKMFIGSMFF